jgi:cytochrome c oxidase cbb3-type subunit 3
MRRVLLAAAIVVLAPGCWREKRDLREVPASAERVAPVRIGTLQPGPPLPGRPVRGAYQGNAPGISEGQRLFDWYNCSGCHGHGGGSIGPPLMDDAWIYGSDPENVFDSIAEGRPNGMPSFGGHIPEQQIWQLVAYVRSLDQLEPFDAYAPRSDGMARNSTAQPKK